MQSVESCITLVNLYLQKLKEGNVYDNSIIIIIADHGNNDYYGEDNMNQHPILLVKGINERHGFQTDNRPISFSDLQDAYIQLLDGGDGQVAFSGVTNDKQNRRFIWYDIKDDTYMVEYEQTGRAGDMDTMVPTGREYNACE